MTDPPDASDRTARAATEPATASSEGSARPQPRRIMIFVVVSLALLMSSLDQTIVATALHSMQHGLDASITWAGWTITAYSLGLVLMLPLAGTLSDRYGRRRVFLGSVIVFTAASLCCGLVDNIYLLVALRAVQALGGAGFTPSATGIVVEHFGSARDKAVGLFGSIFPIGAMAGPVLGGLFVQYWSWRGIFLVNVPIGAVLVVLCLRFIPADTQLIRGVRAHLDVSGMALLGTGVLAAMIGANFLGESGVRPWSPPFVVAAVVALVALVAFARHITRVSDPIIAPRLIRGRGFAAVNVINVVYGGAVAGLVALIPLYATDRYGIDALGSGTLLTAQSVAVIILSSAAAFALRRTGYRSPMYIGAVVVGAGLVLLALAPIAVSPYWWLTLGGCVIGAGTGWLSPASRNACLQLAPEHSASLAALRSMGRQTGSIASISIATAIIAQASVPGTTLAHIFVAGAVLMVLTLPAIARVPEHRGAW